MPYNAKLQFEGIVEFSDGGFSFTHPPPHTRTHTHSHTHARTHAHTHTHARTHALFLWTILERKERKEKDAGKQKTRG